MRKMFASSVRRLQDDCGISAAEKNKFENVFLDNGDHALEWAIYYYTKDHCCPVNLKSVVIPECLCRESSVFTVHKAAGSPTQAFGMTV